ncbi:hypothetical protein [Desulfomarina profundi]|uniref:hypothetical protein n=1 Tax=Desulfomarina profundi TaxID=2772557 RepID=UPI001E2B1725|nr:hypothetical protein [Desulfomarina profundi]
MIPELLQSTNLFKLLHHIDIDLADQQHKAGCPYCGSPQHYSNYQRQPRGGPDLPEEYSVRFSLCCSKENCRRRTLPKSTLFMDRRVYFRVVILIVTTLNQSKPQEYSKNMVSKMLGADRKTISKWLTYFREIFPKSQLWQTIRGSIHPAVTNHTLPGSLVGHYLETKKSSSNAILNCLVLLATGTVMEQ